MVTREMTVFDEGTKAKTIEIHMEGDCVASYRQRGSDFAFPIESNYCEIEILIYNATLLRFDNILSREPLGCIPDPMLCPGS